MTNNQTPQNPIQRRQARRKRIKRLMQWFGYPLGGFGIAPTIFFFRIGKPLLAILTAFASLGFIFLAIAAKFFSDIFDSILDKIEEKLEGKVDPLASWVVEGLEDFVINFWWRLTSKFQSRYYQQLVYDCRDYKTFGLKTKGEFTFEFEKIFVPLRVSPESLQDIHGDIIRSHNNDKETTIWNFLVESKDTYQFRKIAIIGKPGSGKTTLLKDLTLTYAQNRHRRQHRKAPKLFPILIYLRDVRDIITKKDSKTNQYLVNTVTLPEVIEQLKSVKKLNPPKGVFKDFLNQKDCLVMFDGLDEVAEDGQRKAVSHWVNEQVTEYQKARFLITSRPFGYHNAPVENINTILDVKLFNLGQVEKFINNWYLQREIMSRVGKDDPGVRQEAKSQADDLMNRIKNNNTLASLAVNPLLLTMIATVHCYRGALPGRRVELYAEICDVLLGRRDDAKGIKSNQIHLTPDQQKAVLQVLAFRLTAEKETREFSLELGSELIKDKLKDVANRNLTPQKFIKNVEKRSGLLVERENNLYEFAHKSFQEYLTATEIQKSNQEEILIKNINNPWWEETIRLYAAQTDATNLVNTALENPDVTALKLALDCCDEGLSVNAQVKESLYQQIQKGLESDNKDEFELAAKVKLSRRLSKLVRIDDNLEIDREYITCAEYQLFLNHWNSENGEIDDYSNNLNNRHFPAGDAENPLTNINWEQANIFCAWLSQYFQSPDNLYYRLPRQEERENYPAKDDSWLAYNCIRLVRFSIPSRYNTLTYLLASQQWREADEETYQVMLNVANSKKGYLDIEDIENFPVDELRIIDQLWVDYSNGHFGFSVQKQIWLDCGGKIGKYDSKAYYKFGDRIGWRKDGEWLSYSDFTFNTNALLGHLPAAAVPAGFLGWFDWLMERGREGVGRYSLFSSL